MRIQQYTKRFSSFTTKGFTLVELLIVIVVIAILAAISIVAYNGVQTRANNTVVINELVAWQKLFETYRAQEGSLPAMANGGYCLGTGFPSGPNGPGCRDYAGTGSTTYLVSSSTGLMTELQKAATKLPQGPRTQINGTVGPYVNYSSTNIILMTVIRGGSSDCPRPTVYSWDDGNGRLLCSITIQK